MTPLPSLSKAVNISFSSYKIRLMQTIISYTITKILHIAICPQPWPNSSLTYRWQQYMDMVHWYAWSGPKEGYSSNITFRTVGPFWGIESRSHLHFPITNKTKHPFPPSPGIRVQSPKPSFANCFVPSEKNYIWSLLLNLKFSMRYMAFSDLL